MSIASLQPMLPVHLMPAPPEWVRPAAEKTAPAQETQRDGERQNNPEERRLRNLPVPGGRETARPESRPSRDSGDRPGALTEEERQRVEALRARDREVRAHERAHQAAGGDLAGAATYEEVRGPDGRLYAIGGEVPIDASPEADPEDTIAKMERVKRAALAPAEPSAQDRAVAAAADAQANQARAELARREREEAAAAYDRAQGYGRPAAASAGRLDLVA